MKLINFIIIFFVKLYKFFVSPFFPLNCRYLPTCSSYFIECVEMHGSIKGSILGLKRILKCHPIKFLGGGSGLDPVPNLNKKKK